MARHLKCLSLSASLLLAFALTACASVSQPKSAAVSPSGVAALAGDARLGAEIDEICFINNIPAFEFTDIENKSVVMSTGAKGDYLLSFIGACNQLGKSRHVGLETQTSCLRDRDVLLVSRNEFFLPRGNYFPPQRCMIDAIHKWDKTAKQPSIVDM